MTDISTPGFQLCEPWFSFHVLLILAKVFSIAFAQGPDALDNSMEHSTQLKECPFAAHAGVSGLAIAKVSVCV